MIPHLFRECCWLGLPKEIKVQTSKNYERCRDKWNYAIWTKRDKLQHEKKPVLNLKSMQSLGSELTNIYKIYWDFCSARIISWPEKTVVETISVAITDSSDVRCFDLYLINIFTKSTNGNAHWNTLFRSPRCYFRCTTVAWHERVPNFSCTCRTELYQIKIQRD